MDLAHAELLVAVSRSRNLQEAAEELSITPSTLSKRLLAWESELGVDVLLRTRDGSALTSHGRMLLPWARTVLDNLAAARRSVGAPGPSSAHLRVVTFGNSVDRLLAVLATVDAEYPDLHVDVLQATGEQSLLDQVRDRTAEVGFGYLREDVVASAPLADLSVALAGYDECCIVLPPQFADLPNPMLIEHLPDLPVIAAPDDAVSRSAVETALARARVRPRVGTTTHLRSMLIPLVEAGAGMAWSTVASAAMTATTMQIRTFADPILLPLYTVSSSQPGHAQRMFLDHLGRDGCSAQGNV